MSDYDAPEKFNRFKVGLEILSRLENERNVQESVKLDEATDNNLAATELRFHYPLPSLENLDPGAGALACIHCDDRCLR